MRLTSTGAIKQLIKVASVIAGLSISTGTYAENTHTSTLLVVNGTIGAEAESAYFQPVDFRHRHHHRSKRHGHKLRSRHFFLKKKLHKKFHGSKPRSTHHKGLKHKRYRKHGGITYRYYRF